MYRLFFFFLVVIFSHNAFAQLKPVLQKAENKNFIAPENISPVLPLRADVPLTENPFLGKNNFAPISYFPVSVKNEPNLKAYISQELNTAYFIKGNYELKAEKNKRGNIDDYLNTVQPYLKMKNPVAELSLVEKEVEPEKAFEHWRFQQVCKGVPVYGGEAKIHLSGNSIYLFNGRIYPTPEIKNVVPEISKDVAESLAMETVSEFTKVKELSFGEMKLISGEQKKSELVIYHLNNKEYLAWHVTVIPNAAHKYAYFIDAINGEILNHYSELCKIAGHFHFDKNENKRNEDCRTAELNSAEFLDGPATANAVDLFGITRLINTYDVNGDFFLIDASRPMFNLLQSDMPGSPVGVAWTIDGQNNSPENNNFQAVLIGSGNNTWINPTAVSAHYNSGLAYEYFKNKFGRESINGQGGNIVSLINITESDGQDMDNAFWNGVAMWYGNGDVAFDEPLAKSPDVAGHEMSHGVVQSTANLEYYGESGALNESFADVFGALIDPDQDWQIGEDITNHAIFTTDVLRDMQDPHNGGNSLNDNGYQPAHYDERYTGTADNAGVHINSGIPNKAFQLFADAIGKDKAEQVYYRALTKYLFRSAQFIDCRLAVIQATEDLYGSAEVAAAQDAFAAVGIGAGSGTNSQQDTELNPGDDFILMTDDNYDQLYIYTPDEVEIANPLSQVSPLSRPSVTDDGSSIVYIATDNTMRAINIDWQAGYLEPLIIQGDPMWRNVAVSRDGRHLAALTTDNDNELWVYDYNLQQWQIFNLFNPTTGQGGPTTGDVRYADVLEWDFTGEWVMYDALNEIGTASGSTIDYWDVSFARVWDNGSGNFADGFTSKLFSGLPEDVSIGNPTFSKNSDYIIAFDYIDGFNEEYSLQAANLETNQVGVIFNNLGLSWPSYSADDTRIVFDAENTNGVPVLAFVPLADDKISADPNGQASVFLNNKRWGVWFANGIRDLVDADELFAEGGIKLFPNPVKDQLILEWTSEAAGEATLEVFDLYGKNVKTEKMNVYSGPTQWSADLGDLVSGQYVVRLLVGQKYKTFKVIKN